MSTPAPMLPASAPDSVSDSAAALAMLAFGSHRPVEPRASLAQQRLAMLSPEALDLDLSDPRQRQLGDYELLAKLGEGGMGVVFRAHQRSLDREVAVKLLAAGPWASPGFVERFRVEAQSAARMQHPNIVTIFEIGSADGLPFFSMRLVRGASLAERLHSDGPFAPRRAAGLLRTVAEAVEYAHRLGVLHLDLKPGNVLLDERGEPLVADFGLARRLEQGGANVSDEISGTPSYMAPEQVLPGTHRLTEATDVHAMGAMLYELLTGRPPYLGASPRATLQQVVAERPANPRAIRAEVPLDLAAIVLKCLAKEPARRYASARALAEVLGRFLESREVAARPLARGERLWRLARREPRLSASVALLLLSLLAGLAGTTLQSQRAQRSEQRSSSLLWEGRREAVVQMERGGRGLEALPRLTLNIAEQELAGLDPAGDRLHAGLLLSSAPVPVEDVTIDDAAPLASALSPEGRTLALAFNDYSVRWYDTATMAERGRLGAQDVPVFIDVEQLPMLLRFAGEDRLIVTMDWMRHNATPPNLDSHLVDLGRGAWVEPPAGREIASMAFSGDATHAVLMDRGFRAELWQVEPWRRIASLGGSLEGGQEVYVGADLRYVVSLFNVSSTLFWAERDGATWREGDPQFVATARGVLAMTGSGDGRTLAFGDDGGGVFLIDVATREVRRLPTPAGGRVTWVAFSEDDSWLAAGNADGTACAFDVRSGQPLAAGVMQDDFPVQQVGISRRQRLLIAAGAGRIALWRLPAPGPDAQAAERLPAGPTPDAAAEPYSVSWSLQAGLLATAGRDGRIRLWRMPRPAWLEAETPRLLAERLHFDGRHLVDVAWNRIRVLALDGRATNWLELEQPPGFAELVDGGRRVVVSVGRELRVLDASNLKPAIAALALPDSPMHLELDPSGRLALVGLPGSDASGFTETLRLYDLESGRRLPGEAVVGGPLRRMLLSDDRRRVLATGEVDDATTVFDADGLEVIGTFRHEASLPVLWSEFARGSDAIWLAIRGEGDELAAADSVVLWDPATDAWREERAIAGARPFALIDTGVAPFVVGWKWVAFDPQGSRSRVHAVGATSPPLAATALSPDGRLFAHATGNAVQLYSALDGAAIGSPLRASVPASIARLAFAPDGRGLLGRTLKRSWVWWRIEPDARPVASLASAAARLSGAESASPDGATRRELKSRDPGRWPQAEPRPQRAYARELDGVQLAARPADISPLMLDLGPWYNMLADTEWSGMTNFMASMAALPAGVQRLRGVDFEWRGLVMLQQDGLNNGAHSSGHDGNIYFDLPARAAGIGVPDVGVAAFHVLLLAVHDDPVPDERDYAHVRVHYRDGSEAQLTLRTQRDVPGHSGHDRPTPLAWVDYERHRLEGYLRPVPVSAVRLPNPHPERRVASIDLEALPPLTRRQDAPPGVANSAPAFLAVTIEPVEGSAPSTQHQ